MTRSIPIEKILDDCMIAWVWRSLRSEQGYPARLVPGWEEMWVKVKKVEFGDLPYMTREETQNTQIYYLTGKQECLLAMDAKSVVTSPSRKGNIEKGVHQLRGLAWSGRGKIKRVDVSLDGGKN